MEIQLIRNATMKIKYAGKTILTDPMFSPKDAMDPFAGIARNPTVDMKFTVEDVLAGVDGLIVSHEHPDHFDPAASQALAKSMPAFCQPDVEGRLKTDGFENIFPIESTHAWDGISITRTGGKHGKGEILGMMGQVSGFVFQAAGEPTVYWVGDSIWCGEVEEAIRQFSPDVIITHSGAATIPGHEAIIMDGQQTLTTVKAAPDAVVVAIHLESLDHCLLKREELREMADAENIPAARLVIPDDGEIIRL